MRPNLKSIITAVAVILAAMSIASSCTPEEIASYATMNPAEQAAVKAHLQAQAEPVEQTHTAPGGFLACVRRHESGGNYQAQNPTSTASGAYQFLNSTWRTLSARAGYGGYSTAASAPPYIQDAVAVFTVNSGWRSAWNGTGC